MKGVDVLGGIVIALVFLTIVFMGGYVERGLLRDLQNDPKKELYCHFASGWQHVPTHRIKDFDGSTWFFDNGHAKNCKIIKL